MADKKILLFAVLLLAACTADPAMDGADGGNSSANTAAAAKLINTPYDAKQGSLIVCFDDAAVPTIEATAASFAATRGDAGDAAVLTRSGIAPVDEVLQGLEITSLRRVFPYTPRHEERTRAAGLHKWYVVTFDEQADLEAAALKLAAVAEVRNVEFNTKLYVTSVGYSVYYEKSDGTQTSGVLWHRMVPRGWSILPGTCIFNERHCDNWN